MFRRLGISDATAEERICMIVEAGNNIVPDFVAVSRLYVFPKITSGLKLEGTLPADLGKDRY